MPIASESICNCRVTLKRQNRFLKSCMLKPKDALQIKTSETKTTFPTKSLTIHVTESIVNTNNISLPIFYQTKTKESDYTCKINANMIPRDNKKSSRLLTVEASTCQTTCSSPLKKAQSYSLIVSSPTRLDGHTEERGDKEARKQQTQHVNKQILNFELDHTFSDSSMIVNDKTTSGVLKNTFNSNGHGHFTPDNAEFVHYSSLQNNYNVIEKYVNGEMSKKRWLRRGLHYLQKNENFVLLCLFLYLSILFIFYLE